MDITDLASLPTDSLYKFVSMFGVLVLFVSIALPELFKKNFKFQLFDIRKKHDIHKLENEKLVKEIDGLMNDAQATRAKLLNIIKDGDEIDVAALKTVAEIQSHTDEISEKFHQLEVSAIEVNRP